MDIHEPDCLQAVIDGYGLDAEARATLAQKVRLCHLIRLVGEARWMYEGDMPIDRWLEQIRAFV